MFQQKDTDCITDADIDELIDSGARKVAQAEQEVCQGYTPRVGDVSAVVFAAAAAAACSLHCR